VYPWIRVALRQLAGRGRVHPPPGAGLFPGRRQRVGRGHRV